VVAIASRGALAAATLQWLRALRAEQLDVALISDDDTLSTAHPAADVPVREVKRLGPLTLIRALEIEAQVRTIDVVVPAGARAAVLGRVVPQTLWPKIPDLALDLHLDANEAARRVRRALGRGEKRPHSSLA
jgi:hypothetical protein